MVWCEFSNIVVLLQAYRAVLNSSGSDCRAVFLLTSMQPNGKGGVHRVTDTVVIGGDQVSEVADGLVRHIVPILESDTGRPHVARSRMREEAPVLARREFAAAAHGEVRARGRAADPCTQELADVCMCEDIYLLQWLPGWVRSTRSMSQLC